MPERSKPFLLVGSSLAAIFVAGMMALTIAMVANVQPTADQGSDDMAVHPGAAAPPPALQGAPPTAPQLLPKTVPAPAPAAPPPARIAMAQLMDSARPAAASGGAQRCARPGRATTRTRPSAARCASAGDTAASHPVAATDCSATPLLQPAGPMAAAAEATAATVAGMGTAAVTQPATGHSPSSDVVSMMRPSATQAAP